MSNWCWTDGGIKLLPTVDRNTDGFPEGERDLARYGLSFLKQKKKLQLTLERHEFEVHRSTYM